VTTTTRVPSRPRRAIVVVAIAIALLLPLAFFTAADLLADALPHLRSGTVPADGYVRNYVLHPTPALLHIGPGFVYLVGALFQLSARFRRRHLTLHRRMGRVLVVAGIVAVASALWIGIDHPFDGWSERSATIVFGGWMLWCLLAAFAAIRRRDVARHRRWMIRAFAAGFGITMIRVWTGIFSALAVASSSAPPGPGTTGPQVGTFGVSFWLGFAITVAAGEWWLRRPARQRGPVTSG
jgi:uncharacterized membrane protein